MDWAAPARTGCGRLTVTVTVTVPEVDQVAASP